MRRWLDRGKARILWQQLRHPGRLLSYAGLRGLYRLRPLRVPLLPVTLDVEPNNNCNFECPHCQVTHWSKKTVHLDADGFRRILDQLPHLARVKLQGMGEPLLNKQSLALLALGEERGISMRLNSNGSVRTDEIERQLLALRQTLITISIDGATAATFEAVRVGGKFDKVVANVRRLVEGRGASKVPGIELWTVVSDKNVHELESLVRLCKEVGADRISFQLFMTDWGKDSMKPFVETVRPEGDQRTWQAHLDGAKALAAELGVELQVFTGNLLSRQRPCEWPWTSAYIAANGDVVPCCIVADADTARMGNVFEQDFAVIWNSPAYQELRRQIRDHDLPEYCRGCYSDAPPPREPRARLPVVK